MNPPLPFRRPRPMSLWRRRRRRHIGFSLLIFRFTSDLRTRVTHTHTHTFIYIILVVVVEVVVMAVLVVVVMADICTSLLLAHTSRTAGNGILQKLVNVYVYKHTHTHRQTLLETSSTDRKIYDRSRRASFNSMTFLYATNFRRCINSFVDDTAAPDALYSSRFFADDKRNLWNWNCHGEHPFRLECTTTRNRPSGTFFAIYWSTDQKTPSSFV